MGKCLMVGLGQIIHGSVRPRLQIFPSFSGCSTQFVQFVMRSTLLLSQGFDLLIEQGFCLLRDGPGLYLQSIQFLIIFLWCRMYANDSSEASFTSLFVS